MQNARLKYSRTTLWSVLYRAAMICLVLGALVANETVVWAKGGGPNVNGAKLYIQQNDLDQALKALNREITEVNPNNEDAWYLLGYVYARKKQYDKMVEAFNKAVELKPKFHEKGIKISKDSGTQFHSKFGADLILKIVWGNAFNRGVKYFNQAVNAADDSTRTKSYEGAVEAFRAAAMIMPDSTLAYRNEAAALLNLGRYEESIAPLKEALAHQPDDVEVKTMLAQVYVANHADSLAVPILEDLWQHGAHSEEVADNLSRAYVRMGQKDKAKAIYEEAIKLNPANFQFRYNYGTILLEAQEYDAAIEQLQKAYELDQENPDLNYNLGAAYLNRGVAKREALPEDSEEKPYLEDFKLALPYLEKSVKMNPDDENVWFTLGRIAGQLNKISLAGYAFSKGEPEKSALDGKVVVGMQADMLKTILGEPNKVNPLESELFADVEEWVYNSRKGTNGKVAIPQPLNVYVKDGRVDALMVVK